MERFWLLLGLLIVGIVGLIQIVIENRGAQRRRSFALEFHRNLKEYVESRGQQQNSYQWMVQHANRMQLQLGRGGIMAHYRPPFESHYVTNYPIVLNMVPELRRSFGMSIGDDRLANEFAQLIQDALVRHYGDLDEELETGARRLLNPIVWLRQGIWFLLSLPVRVLAWFGIIPARRIHRSPRSVFFRVVSFLVALIMFISAIVTLVVGWESFTRSIATLVGE